MDQPVWAAIPLSALPSAPHSWYFSQVFLPSSAQAPMPGPSVLLHSSSPHHLFLGYLPSVPWTTATSSEPSPDPPLRLRFPSQTPIRPKFLPQTNRTGGTKAVASHSCLFLKESKNLIDLTRPGSGMGEGATTSDLQDCSTQWSRLHQPDPQFIRRPPGHSESKYVQRKAPAGKISISWDGA